MKIKHNRHDKSDKHICEYCKCDLGESEWVECISISMDKGKLIENQSYYYCINCYRRYYAN